MNLKIERNLSAMSPFIKFNVQVIDPRKTIDAQDVAEIRQPIVYCQLLIVYQGWSVILSLSKLRFR